MTVNCPNCGGPISVTDEYCPYCGSLNQTKEKEKVKKAENKAIHAEKKASLTIPLIVIVVLIVLNLVAAGIAAGAYRSGYEKRKEMNEARADEIYAQFKSYIDDHDYLLANAYENSGDYYSISTMKPYRLVIDGLGYYSTIFFYVAPERPNRYSGDKRLDNIGALARNLDSFYDLSSHSYYDYTPAEDADEIMNDITTEIEALVAAAYHLTPEETAGMDRMKEDEIAELLKDAYIRSEGAKTETEEDE